MMVHLMLLGLGLHAAPSHTVVSPPRRRLSEERWSEDACATFDLVAWSGQVEARCCPLQSPTTPGSGHRRALQAPGSSASPCGRRPPSTCAGECALIFLPLMIGCGQTLGLSAAPELATFAELCGMDALLPTGSAIGAQQNCAVDNGGCQGSCKDSGGGTVVCGCPEGYALMQDTQSCIDLDECADGNGGCSDICLNTVGGHRCSCSALDGVLDSGGLTCHGAPIAPTGLSWAACALLPLAPSTPPPPPLPNPSHASSSSASTAACLLVQIGSPALPSADTARLLLLTCLLILSALKFSKFNI